MRSLGLMLCATLVFGQITKNQVYELVDHNVSTQTIVEMIQTNCVDFVADGATIVELTSRVPSSVLKAIVDCPNNDMKPKTQAMTANTKPSSAARPSSSAFEASNYVTVELSSNKDTFIADEIRVRVVPAKGEPEPKWEYQSSGKLDLGSEKRCFRTSGPEFMEKADYIVYFYVLSSRNTGFLRKSRQHTDLFRIHLSVDGPGPLSFLFHSEEEKGLSQDQAFKLTTRGPITEFAKDHVHFVEQKSFENIENMFN